MRDAGTDQYSERPRYDSDNERTPFDEAVAQTLKQANMLLAEKQQALEMASRNGQTLLLECEKMSDDNEKWKKLNSVNVTFHREISERFDGDLQSMTVFRNDLQEL